MAVPEILWEGLAVLYFAYTSLIEPKTLNEVCPGAEFSFIAHLPEFGLGFPYKNGKWDGGLPSARPEQGSTVWGAVFELNKSQMNAVGKLEASEGRKPTTLEVMDRGGRRHEVQTFMHNGKSNGKKVKPSTAYVRQMLNGGRHWQLPAGWIAGLEEHL